MEVKRCAIGIGSGLRLRPMHKGPRFDARQSLRHGQASAENLLVSEGAVLLVRLKAMRWPLS